MKTKTKNEQPKFPSRIDYDMNGLDGVKVSVQYNLTLKI
jgi:hypothetical protein